ncbi:hypothetical protein E1B28_012471 [Marasmius oreades]|uniref:Protein phosphatase n=1 Tax=Marasmius oreades TaxID=181124 RepID=A0A9P7RSX5_9AGAR|nr:uncharacterized protein E1B28_012471 [Marasmius oreades]KAG7088483.1 hypothetical protein E1B28_012471 [Marasmius oreades]
MSAKRFPQTRLPVAVYSRQQRSLYTAPVVTGNPRNAPTIQSQAPRILADAGKGSEQHSSNAAHHGTNNAILALPYPYSSSSSHTQTNPPPSSHPNPHHFNSSSSAHPSTQSKQSSVKRRTKRGPRYQLDVGAYGIPKKSSTPPLRHVYTDSPLSVSVGEDAYFIRGDAIGVADGVGGWSKLCPPCTSTSTPSAAFAKRLMHYCSAEIHDFHEARSSSNPPPSSFNPALNNLLSSSPFYSPFSSPFYSPSSSQWSPFSPPPPPQPFDEFQDMEHQLSEELEELEEGIDVLVILERAYQKTLDAHVTDPPTTAESSSTPLPPRHRPESLPNSYPPSQPWFPSLRTSVLPKKDPQKQNVPLMAGSSTVLLAVLDHVPKGQLEVKVEMQPKIERTDGLQARGSDELQAVLKLAHVGDCMGMLVRGDEVVWRSEEMWWNFNTPVQLGPLSPITPSSTATSARTFTLPVQADDILILASDGLSDNLWDEEVMDEVKRFRKGGWLLSTPNDTSGSEFRSEDGLLWRRTLAGMLSEALCSRGKKVSARKRAKSKGTGSTSASGTSTPVEGEIDREEIPFARRAREAGRSFSGGKGDDITVVVAVISPADGAADKKLHFS